MSNSTSKEYEQKIDNLSLEIVQLIMANCSDIFGHDLTDFKQCQGIIEGELRNPILNALDHHLHGNK